MKYLAFLAVMFLAVPALAMSEADLTVTNTATVVTSLTGGSKVPQNVPYLVIENPSSTASLAFTINGATPVVNGLGITLGPLGSQTFDAPTGVGYPIGSLKIISSSASQSATLLYP